MTVKSLTNVTFKMEKAWTVQLLQVKQKPDSPVMKKWSRLIDLKTRRSNMCVTASA